MKKTFILIVTALLLAGCGNFYVPSVEKARETAGAFMTRYYVDMEFDSALELASDSFRQRVNSGTMVKDMSAFYKKYGRMQGFSAESYIVESKTKLCAIYYRSICEKKFIYNKIVLSGDAKSGYRVEAAFASELPFKEYQEQKKFKKE